MHSWLKITCRRSSRKRAKVPAESCVSGSRLLSLFLEVHVGLFVLLAVVIGPSRDSLAQEPRPSVPKLVALRGRVVDARTGEPISKALVSLRALNLETVTGPDGRFLLPAVPVGTSDVYVTTVGYGLLRKKLNLQEDVELEIQLGQGALKVAEEITVTASPFDPIEPGIVSEHTLDQNELKNLAGVLLDDPLRSIQSLPGVASGDDFRAQFAIRGFGFDRVGLYLDGVLTRSPFHTVRDIQDEGSLTILNGDLVESVSFLSGSPPSKYGDRLAAVVNVATRDGNRQETSHRANVSGSGLSWASEGPVGSSKQTSWLVSARKSYLDWLIKKLSEDPDTASAFGFSDVQGKLSHRVSDRQQLHLMALIGFSGADESRRRQQLGPNSFLKAQADTQLFNLAWRFAPAAGVWIQSSLFHTQETALNRNRDGEVLFDAAYKQSGVRIDAARQWSQAHRLEAGFLARHLKEVALQRRFDFQLNRFLNRNAYRSSAWQPGGYLQHTWSVFQNRLALLGGGRVDRFGENGETVWLPRVGVSLAVSQRLKLSATYSQQAQFPDFSELYGEFRHPELRAERASHWNVVAEHQWSEKMRFRIEGYDVKVRRLIFSPFTEFRLVNGVLTGPCTGNVLRNGVHGYSRGVELMLQRRSANKLSGWLSYNYGVARFTDDPSGLRFAADFDQKHTVNLYGSYRLTQSLNVSSKYRYGSNFPIMGFFRQQGSAYFLSDQRNRLRVPSYSRLDLRVNKSFHFDRLKMTLYGELLNATSRANYRFTGINSIRAATGEVRLARDSILPILPIGGLTVEF
ncbi:MAG: TonB-dependent receptor [Acidimicrobiia bacterium]|nr:TonB-dependent receptor [Acidimicrobiia bacterium]